MKPFSTKPRKLSRSKETLNDLNIADTSFTHALLGIESDMNIEECLKYENEITLLEKFLRLSDENLKRLTNVNTEQTLTDLVKHLHSEKYTIHAIAEKIIDAEIAMKDLTRKTEDQNISKAE